MAREIFIRRRADAPFGSISSAKHEDYPQSLVHDKYAIIALINSKSVTVSHLPKFMSKLAHFLC